MRANGTAPSQAATLLICGTTAGFDKSSRALFRCVDASSIAACLTGPNPRICCGIDNTLRARSTLPAFRCCITSSISSSYHDIHCRSLRRSAVWPNTSNGVPRSRFPSLLKTLGVTMRLVGTQVVKPAAHKSLQCRLGLRRRITGGFSFGLSGQFWIQRQSPAMFERCTICINCNAVEDYGCIKTCET